MEILRSLLTPEERAGVPRGDNWGSDYHFVQITGSEGGRYRLLLGHYSGNIYWRENFRHSEETFYPVSLCAHPSFTNSNNSLSRTEFEDKTLISNIAQIQVIKHDESLFLKTAYASGSSDAFNKHKREVLGIKRLLSLRRERGAL